MRIALLGLVFFGCATAKPYTGVTEAQVRWRDAYAACQGSNSPECNRVRAQFTIEDAYEREQRQAADQRVIDEHRNQRRTAYIARPQPQVVQVQQPLFPAQTTMNCRSTTYGGTTRTTCN